MSIFIHGADERAVRVTKCITKNSMPIRSVHCVDIFLGFLGFLALNQIYRDELTICHLHIKFGIFVHQRNEINLLKKL